MIEALNERVILRSLTGGRQVVRLLSCTTLLLPDNEPINITLVQTVRKYNCLYDTSPEYNAISVRITKIHKDVHGIGTSLPHYHTKSSTLFIQVRDRWHKIIKDLGDSNNCQPPLMPSCEPSDKCHM